MTAVVRKPILQSYVPVIFALITPFCFTGRVLLIRRMTNEKFGICFDTTTLSMTVFMIDNLIFFILALFYWNYFVKIDWYALLMGTIGAIVDHAGLNVAYLALRKGPGGPITATFCVSTIFVSIVEALRYLKMPSFIEIIGFIIGFVGSLEFVIPEVVEGIIFFWKWRCFRSNNKGWKYQ